MARVIPSYIPSGPIFLLQEIIPDGQGVIDAKKNGAYFCIYTSDGTCYYFPNENNFLTNAHDLPDGFISVVSSGKTSHQDIANGTVYFCPKITVPEMVLFVLTEGDFKLDPPDFLPISDAQKEIRQEYNKEKQVRWHASSNRDEIVIDGQSPEQTLVTKNKLILYSTKVDSPFYKSLEAIKNHFDGKEVIFDGKEYTIEDLVDNNKFLPAFYITAGEYWKMKTILNDELSQFNTYLYPNEEAYFGWSVMGVETTSFQVFLKALDGKLGQITNDITDIVHNTHEFLRGLE